VLIKEPVISISSKRWFIFINISIAIHFAANPVRGGIPLNDSNSNDSVMKKYWFMDVFLTVI
jgi:hypothetical protein